MFRKFKHIHFIGVGGIGMSGIAELLLEQGFKISGSDINDSELISNLKSKGAIIYIGHNPKNISNSDLVVYSSAIQLENCEIIKAKQTGVPTIKRAEMLGELIKLKEISVGVAGTHGKTTTASLIGNLLSYGNQDPTLIIGGLVQSLKSNSKLGNGNIIVVEADEYDKSFLSMQPTIAVITNLELEHTDCYDNLEELKNCFIKYCNSIPFYGLLSVCIDSRNVKDIITKINKPIVTYGLLTKADYFANEIMFDGFNSFFSLHIKNKFLGRIKLNVPGNHNILNALAAISVCHQLDMSIENIKKGLLEYRGVRRRFDVKYNKNDILVIDDYAHHPTEISVTLDAAKKGWNKRIISIFQPHLFTRTKYFYKEFARALSSSDILILMDIYPAREEPITGISSRLILEEIKIIKKENIFYMQDFDKITKKLNELILPNDLILFLGAGDIWRCSRDYVTLLEIENAN